MLAFLGRRLLFAIPVLWAVLTATFFLIRLAPGSPFSGERAMSEAVREQLAARYQLNGSISEQYFHYLGQVVLHGNLGPSLQYKNRTVNEVIGQTLPISMMLGGVAFCLALSGGMVLGIWAAVHQGKAIDRGAMLLALLGISLPGFVLAPLLILWLGLQWQWVPVAGWGTVAHLVLPAICLASPFAASVARLMRTSMIEVLPQDFVRTARAKGLASTVVVYRHALRLACLPVVSYAGPLAAHLLTGSLVVEQIFSIPGIGHFFINSVLNRDYYMVGGVALVYSGFLVGFNLLVDVLYHVLDKRIRLS
jgi:oligopeptide transport system permease protein